MGAPYGYVNRVRAVCLRFGEREQFALRICPDAKNATLVDSREGFKLC